MNHLRKFVMGVDHTKQTAVKSLVEKILSSLAARFTMHAMDQRLVVKTTMLIIQLHGAVI